MKNPIEFSKLLKTIRKFKHLCLSKLKMYLIRKKVPLLLQIFLNMKPIQLRENLTIWKTAKIIMKQFSLLVNAKEPLKLKNTVVIELLNGFK